MNFAEVNKTVRRRGRRPDINRIALKKKKEDAARSAVRNRYENCAMSFKIFDIAKYHFYRRTREYTRINRMIKIGGFNALS